MYLSKIAFRPRRGPAERIDPYRVHQSLWQAFPSEPREPRPFLFRADIEQDEDGKPRLICLVQSRIEADWPRLKERLTEARQKLYEPRFSQGDRLQFLLRANPTRSRKDRNEPKFRVMAREEFIKHRGRRVGLQREEEQLAWFKRKARDAGFELERQRVGDDDYEAIRVLCRRAWQWVAKGHAARHEGADFEGIMRVLDPKLLGLAVESGIGPAKGLGFGLLSLARPTG
jgi:CRISPR system Cascade subunit CasE